MKTARPARVLHVAALPFPSPQGTQAALFQMLEATADAGHETHLLCYGHGRGPLPRGVRVSRARNPGRDRSLRSGPSPRKLLSDAALAHALSRRVRELGPQLIVAHHVEAAWIARAHANAVFYAHTDLGAELPCYVPAPLRGAAARLGASLDRALLRRYARVRTVSPELSARFGRGPVASGCELEPWLPPWPVPDAIGADERAHARRALQLPADAPVLLYAGNLDRYQRWPVALEVLARLSPRARLIVASESDPSALRQAARRIGVADRIVCTRLHDEPARRRVHAAADLALLPRTLPGGLPIKLLDALARGLPCVATRASCAGLALEGIVWPAGDDAGALHAAVERALNDAAERELRAQRGRAWVRRECSKRRFVDGLEALINP